MSTPPEVSVVIVNWNAGRDLLDCLRSLEAHPPTRPWEAIVVDNASTDGSLPAARTAAPRTRIVANRSNRGLAAANNQGFLAARGNTFVIANPDVTFRTGSIDALVDLLDRRPRAAIAIPLVVQASGEPQVSAGSLPTLREALLPGRARRDRGKAGFWWTQWAHDEEVPVGHGAEACYAVRRASVEDVGAQDERYRLDWEGIEWSARIIGGGWEIWFCPTATVDHSGGTSVKQVPLRWVASSHRGMYRYYADRAPALLRPAIGAAVAARALAKAVGVIAGLRLYDRAHEHASISSSGGT